MIDISTIDGILDDIKVVYDRLETKFGESFKSLTFTERIELSIAIYTEAMPLGEECQCEEGCSNHENHH